MTKFKTVKRLSFLITSLFLFNNLAVSEEPKTLKTIDPIGSYQSPTGEGGAEIVDFDTSTNRLVVTNGKENTVDFINISNPSNPQIDFSVSMAPYGGGVNSVAVNQGRVVVAVEGATKQQTGKAVVMNSAGTVLTTFTTGSLPDMVTFSPDGRYILLANEGEPSDDYSIDPEGSVTIIDLKDGLLAATVHQVGFSSFNNKLHELRNAGVKLYTPNTTVAEDLEPEFITVSPNGNKAFVTMQENNAVAVLDLNALEFVEILPMGTKDFSKKLPKVKNYTFDKLPLLGKSPAGDEIFLGGFSGLYYEGKTPNGKLKFITHPDRGPNGEPTDANNDGIKDRPFPLPHFQSQLIRFTLNPKTGKLKLTQKIKLWRHVMLKNKKCKRLPISGRPNLQAGTVGTTFTDENPVDLYGNSLPNDPFGADMEGIVVDEDGSFWMCDEYRPSIYHFNRHGVLIRRYVPKGTAAAGGKPLGYYGHEELPKVYASRRKNRGFEAIAIEGDKIYAFMQSPLDNPDVSDIQATNEEKKSDYNSRNSKLIRIVELDKHQHRVTAEYAYLFEGASGVDKIGDATSLGGGRFAVIERDSSTASNARKYIFEIDLKGATNLLDLPESIRGIDGTLEGMTAKDLHINHIVPVFKRKILNLPSVGYRAGAKPEGLALVGENTLAVINDNDFGLSDTPVSYDGSVPLNPNVADTVLGLIKFKRSNKLDTSDKDNIINFRHAPVLGMYQPDAIASYAIKGETYFLTANEGDARDYNGYSEEQRVKDLPLDSSLDATVLQTDHNIGRMKTTSEMGDIDGDGDVDRIYVYGARSFSIRDSNGGLVFDSGDKIAKLVNRATPHLFNADYDEDSSTFEFDKRSDDKGIEPEAITVGEVNGKWYAFVGIERAGSGVFIFNVTNPRKPRFINYLRSNRDIGTEGLIFISKSDSPSLYPLLAVANEISGTVSVYELNENVLK